MQKKTNNKRVIILSVLAVLSGIFYFIVANTILPFANVCEDVDYAKQQYANKDVKKRNKFIVERNNHCKVLLSERKSSKGLYNQLENCAILDYALEASDKYIALNKQKSLKSVRSNIKFFEDNIESYNYCPQYGDVAKKINSLKEEYSK